MSTKVVIILKIRHAFSESLISLMSPSLPCSLHGFSRPWLFAAFAFSPRLAFVYEAQPLVENSVEVSRLDSNQMCLAYTCGTVCAHDLMKRTA